MLHVNSLLYPTTWSGTTVLMISLAVAAFLLQLGSQMWNIQLQRWYNRIQSALTTLLLLTPSSTRYEFCHNPNRVVNLALVMTSPCPIRWQATLFYRTHLQEPILLKTRIRTLYQDSASSLRTCTCLTHPLTQMYDYFFADQSSSRCVIL